MIKITQNCGEITTEFSGNKATLGADVIFITHAMIELAKKHMSKELFLFTVSQITTNIKKEVTDIEEKDSAFPFFGESE